MKRKPDTEGVMKYPTVTAAEEAAKALSIAEHGQPVTVVRSLDRFGDRAFFVERGHGGIIRPFEEIVSHWDGGRKEKP